MSKETFYFSHDYNSCNDVKIKKLLFKHGLLGYGIFWALIEELYNNTNVLPLDYESISFDLRIDESVLKSIINDFDLFQIDENYFGSLSVQNRIEERNLKSKKARESIAKRWNDTNVLRTKYKGNTIKERKVKENKGKESKIKQTDLVFPFDSLQFINSWNILITQPKWKGKTIEALQGNLKTLSEVNEQTAIKMLQDSLNNGWQGVFIPKNLESSTNSLKTSKIQEMSNAYETAKQNIKNGYSKD